MRNFDEEREERFNRERTFQIGGEVFKFKIGLAPEDYAEKIAEYSEMLTKTTTNLEAIAIHDRTIQNFLETDAERERWSELRARANANGSARSAEDMPVTTYDIGQIVLHILAEQMGRPTQAPSSSGDGREPTGQTSMENSSSAPAGVVVSEA